MLGLLFYRDEWIWDDTAYVKAFLEEAEKEGYAVLPVFANGFIDELAGMPSLSEVLETYFMKDGQPLIDALVSTMKFSMLAQERRAFRPEEAWRAYPFCLHASHIRGRLAQESGGHECGGSIYRGRAS